MRLVTWFVVVGALSASCASADKSSGAGQPVKELAVGGARIHGGNIRMDVQLGRPLANRPAKGGTVSVTPHATVLP